MEDHTEDSLLDDTILMMLNLNSDNKGENLPS